MSSRQYRLDRSSTLDEASINVKSLDLSVRR